MVKVRFLQDYRGVLTKEIFYEAGQEAMFSGTTANALAEAGRVEIIAQPKSLVDEPADKPTRRKPPMAAPVRSKTKK